MKKLSRLKLNMLSEQNLENKVMNDLRGGRTCTCSCYWAGQEGSSSTDNSQANGKSGGSSKQGCNQYLSVGPYVGHDPNCDESNSCGCYEFDFTGKS